MLVANSDPGDAVAFLDGKGALGPRPVQPKPAGQAARHPRRARGSTGPAGLTMHRELLSAWRWPCRWPTNDFRQRTHDRSQPRRVVDSPSRSTMLAISIFRPMVISLTASSPGGLCPGSVLLRACRSRLSGSADRYNTAGSEVGGNGCPDSQANSNQGSSLFTGSSGHHLLGCRPAQAADGASRAFASRIASASSAAFSLAGWKTMTAILFEKWGAGRHREAGKAHVHVKPWAGQAAASHGPRLASASACVGADFCSEHVIVPGGTISPHARWRRTKGGHSWPPECVRAVSAINSSR